MIPRISVIIPVFNVETYLDDCLHSIINQSFRNIEIICVDDGSSDSSPQILEKYAQKDGRIKIITLQNSGVSHARNCGLKAATGDYVCFIDADDYLSIDAFEYIFTLIDNSAADIVVFGGKSFPTVQWMDEKLTTRNKTYTDQSIEALLFEKGSRPFTWGKLYRRKLLQENNIHFNEDMDLGEDQIFQFEVFPLAHKVVYTDKKFYFYRQNRPGSLMAKYNMEQEQKVNRHIAIVEYIVEIWKKAQYVDKYGSELAQWILSFIGEDLLNATYNIKKIGCKKMTDILPSITNIEKLSKQEQQQFHQMLQVADSIYNPIISVIIPVYNSEQYLKKCFNSLSKQVFLDFEIIFVDDGSTDNSLKLLNSFKQLDSRVTLLNQNHQYAGVARNLGIQHAQGEYLIFLDSDDWFDADMLATAYEKICKFSADICVFPARGFDNEKHQFTDMPWTCRPSRCPGLDEAFCVDDNEKYIFAFTTPAPWNKLLRKKFVLENQLWFQNTRSANDMAFIMTALTIAKKIVVLDKPLLTYRINNHLSLQGSQEKEPLAFYKALIELKQRLIKYKVYKKVEQAFIVFALDCCLYNLGTLQSKSSFECVYFYLKNTAFQELEIVDKPEYYFYAYTANNYQKKEDILRLGILEYVEKYNLFPQKQIMKISSADRKKIEDRINSLQKELINIRASKSYRIGRIFTYIPRKIRGGIRCCSEHGIKYTLLLAKHKIFH